MEQSRLLATALIKRAEQGVDVTQIAETIISVWEKIDTVLGPILGQRGVALLYKRSLFLTMSAHPWLASTYEGAQTAMDIKVLKSALLSQSSSNVASAGGDLLLTLCELLASLLGPSLTNRLLVPVWTHAARASPAQDDLL